MNFLAKTFAAFVLSSVALLAQASVVSTLSGATAIEIPATYVTTANKLIAPGITFTASTPSVFGYTNTYGFAANGQWSGVPMLGTNNASGYFEINFSSAVSGFLSEVNWTTGISGGDASMAIYGASNNLLETLVLEHNGANMVAASTFYGFSRQTADISRVRFSNEYIGARNMSFRASDVPEPGSLALLGLALAGVALARRRK